MKIKKYICCRNILLLTLALAYTPAWPQATAPEPSNSQFASPEIERRVNTLLEKMTLEEKIGQLVQYDTAGAAAATTAAAPAMAANPEADYHLDAKHLAETGRLGSMLNVAGGETLRSYQQAAVEKSRLHIPLLFGADVIHGYRTIYPIPLGLAASFDPELVTRLSRMAAEEATTAGIRWFYSPMVDISRDARWGRSAEGAGEDPYLGAAMARAYVRGYQDGDLARPASVAACVKHFAAYGAAEAGREYNTTDMSESRLRQVYLPPYKAAVEAGSATVMSAFNSLNGVPATANPYLLDTILRRQWGFNGFVVSDYTAVLELMNHGIALDAATAAEKAFNAGVDVDMMSHLYDAELPGLIKSGRVSEEAVDESVRRVLRVKFALGLFDNPYSTGSEVTSAVAEHRPLVREAAEESFVLLQNKEVAGRPVLPLAPNTKIALIGPLADAASEMQGAWGGANKASDVVTLKAALEERTAAQGGSLVYAEGTEIDSSSEAGFTAAEEAARQADVVVMALGESGSMSGEAGARAHLDLPGNQQALLEQITRLKKPVVLLVFSGRPLVLTWAAQHVPSILEAWFPGTEAGHALARILYGDAVPSGKLPMSFPQTVGQEPLYYSQLPTGRPPNNADLTKPPTPDSRFISRYIDAPNAALFPFGFGLSYTAFSYSDVTLSRETIPLKEAVPRANTLVVATVTVKNTGSRAATEVVQCYVGNQGATLSQPVRSLQGFSRVTLAPGESRSISFPLGFNELSFFDSSGRQVMEPTSYTVWIGGDSLATKAAHLRVAP
ncbi:MAG: glycoside hydrolase family 3 C-terminal domain-containing protein [Acidobacteriaceae bacterium]|nr:glycoside hydrolase family 3 C-terminal domain-containing protein [Acidobacteriaceae bacterium]